jgi:hypothetical protein
MDRLDTSAANHCDASGPLRGEVARRLERELAIQPPRSSAIKRRLKRALTRASCPPRSRQIAWRLSMRPWLRARGARRRRCLARGTDGCCRWGDDRVGPPRGGVAEAAKRPVGVSRDKPSTSAFQAVLPHRYCGPGPKGRRKGPLSSARSIRTASAWSCVVAQGGTAYLAPSGSGHIGLSVRQDQKRRPKCVYAFPTIVQTLPPTSAARSISSEGSRSRRQAIDSKSRLNRLFPPFNRRVAGSPCAATPRCRSSQSGGHVSQPTARHRQRSCTPLG